MKKDKFKKIKQIAAIIGIIILAGMYIVSLVAAIIGSEKSHAIFMASLYCTFFVGAVIFIIELLYRLSHKND